MTFEIDEERVEPKIDNTSEVTVTGAHVKPERIDPKSDAEPIPCIVFYAQKCIGERSAVPVRLYIEPFNRTHETPLFAKPVLAPKTEHRQRRVRRITPLPSAIEPPQSRIEVHRVQAGRRRHEALGP